MAKKSDKSNKTMHVLSLLTADKSPSAQEEASVKVIDSGESGKDKLAEQIEEQLEHALQEELKKTEQESASVLEAEAEKEPEPETERLEEAEPEIASVLEAEQEPEMERLEEAEPEIEHVSEAEAEKEAEPEPEEPDYAFVNVMETIALEHLRENQERFHTCTCNRCTVDVLALTLNEVRPKYVVVQKGAVSALTSFFEKKYMTDLLVAMVKACIQVAKNPRH